MPDVMPIAEARAGLSKTLASFRADAFAAPVIIGSHRKPEAVLVSYLDFVSRPQPRAESVLEVMRRKSGLIHRLAESSRIASVAVFGSVARGDDTPDSDIDLLVDPTAAATLFDLAQFEIDLETLLDRSVDVVSRRALGTGERDAKILAESIPL